MPFSTIGSTVATGLEESLIRDLAADPAGADREPEEMLWRLPAPVLVSRSVNFQERVHTPGEWRFCETVFVARMSVKPQIQGCRNIRFFIFLKLKF